MSTTTTNFGLTKPDATDNVDVSVINTNYDLIDTKAALKANSSGGGELGTSASATTGGAVGNGATAVTGFAGGEGASATNGGAAVGNNAKAAFGGALGSGARASAGGAVGANAITDGGAAVGVNANSQFGAALGFKSAATAGGAVGNGATAGYGFAGGLSAVCQNKIDAIQLGTGTNATAYSMQVYTTPLLTPVTAGTAADGLVIPLSLITASYEAASTDDQSAFKQALGIS